MPLMKRELARRTTGPVSNDEDWWRLVFDTDAGRLYVEHEWTSLERRQGEAEGRTGAMDIAEYLMQSGQTAGHRELWRLLQTLFKETRDPGDQ